MNNTRITTIFGVFDWLFITENKKVIHCFALKNKGYSIFVDKKVEKWIKVGNHGIQVNKKGIQWNYGGNRLITKSKPLVALKH